MSPSLVSLELVVTSALFSYVFASSGRSVLERSRPGVTNGQSAFQASGDVTFRYLIRTGIVASRSDRRASLRTGHQSYKKISSGRHIDTQPPMMRLSRRISPMRLVF